ncbi:hypothetical protein G4B88_028937 [Cannabis sativa]|uniref:Uncharacterized protein n=1 Tax=Cannabis sativa TaxID=3483 RepID=A0A7J6HN20_CANSA|nr:hypothetical protein G4B88_028937 [Cannabis sativa]
MDDESDELFVTNINHSLKPTPTPSSTSTAPRRGMKKLGLGSEYQICVISESKNRFGLLNSILSYEHLNSSFEILLKFKTISPIPHPSFEAVSSLMSPDMGQHGIGGLGMQCKGNEQYAIHNHLFAMEWKAIQAYVIYILTDGQTEVRLFSHVMKSCCSKERRASEDLIQKVLSISSISFRRYELAANVTNPSPSEPRDWCGVSRRRYCNGGS